MTQPASARSGAEPAWLPRVLEGPPSFEDLVAPDVESIDLGLAAAIIARDVYQDLDVWSVLSRLDELAEPLGSLGLPEIPVEAQARAMARHLYECHGFAGNDKHYYDPQNSLLPDVLRRRLGIPITLALIYCEVGKRIGLRTRGVSFPGHFLVRIDRTPPDSGRPIFVDPFSGGQILDQSGLSSLLSRVTGKKATVRPEHLEPASTRATLVRMLSNLKAVYLARGETCRALLAADRVLSVVPESGAALRDRGLLAARLGAVEIARADLTRFLERYPKTEDAKTVKRQLAALDRSRPSLS